MSAPIKLSQRQFEELERVQQAQLQQIEAAGQRKPDLPVKRGEGAISFLADAAQSLTGTIVPAKSAKPAGRSISIKFGPCEIHFKW